MTDKKKKAPALMVTHKYEFSKHLLEQYLPLLDLNV